ncbi:hypothetical protein GCM10022254_30700 [Actinomadura meridiana]|uniref:Uncharacterized protein n=1 Tax=Actinomadura meridiana TaxID=559626 RepID=A0ABP8C1E7_9ACTN
MGLLGRFRRRAARQRGTALSPRGRHCVPTFREMHARMRTERAEAALLETEAQIHQEAKRYRRGARFIG